MEGKQCWLSLWHFQSYHSVGAKSQLSHHKTKITSYDTIFEWYCSHNGIQKNYQLLLCILHHENSHRHGFRRHYSFTCSCLCGIHLYFQLYVPQNSIPHPILHTSQKLPVSLYSPLFHSQADKTSEEQRISAFGILSGIKAVGYVCGTFLARLLPIATVFQVFQTFFLPT